MPAGFHLRSEYRSPTRVAFNAVGTEGCRSPGNLPRTFGMLNVEKRQFGTTAAYSSDSKTWSRFAPAPQPVSPNFREASHAMALSPLRGDHLANNSNLDDYGGENNFRYLKESSVANF